MLHSGTTFTPTFLKIGCIKNWMSGCTYRVSAKIIWLGGGLVWFYCWKTLCKIKHDFVGSISNVAVKQLINVDLVTVKCHQ